MATATIVRRCIWNHAVLRTIHSHTCSLQCQDQVPQFHSRDHLRCSLAKQAIKSSVLHKYQNPLYTLEINIETHVEVKAEIHCHTKSTLNVKINDSNIEIPVET